MPFQESGRGGGGSKCFWATCFSKCTGGGSRGGTFSKRNGGGSRGGAISKRRRGGSLGGLGTLFLFLAAACVDVFGPIVGVLGAGTPDPAGGVTGILVVPNRTSESGVLGSGICGSCFVTILLRRG